MFEYYKDAADKWRWRAIADNGRIVGSSSQGYASKERAADNVVVLQEILLTETGISPLLQEILLTEIADK